MALFGAFLTVLTLAIGPFIQQVVSFPTIYPNSTQAGIPIATRLKDGGAFSGSLGSGVRTGDIDLNMLAAIYAGLYSSTDTDFNVTSTCSTHNCSWSSYETLAVCSTCANLTSQLTTSVNEGNEGMVASDRYRLPNGFGLEGVQLIGTGNGARYYNSSLNISTPGPAMTSDSDTIFNPIAFPNMRSVLTDLFAVASFPVNGTRGGADDLFPSSPLVAWECMLQFCIHEMAATEADGSFVETTTATWTNNSQALPDLNSDE